MAEALVAIVTGGVQGLGAAIAEVLLKKGYKVCVSDIQTEKGKEFEKSKQGVYGSQNIIFTVCDVTKEDDYKKLFDVTLHKFGKIDLVVNNAGILLEQNPRKCIEVNLLGPVTGCHLALQYMGKSKGGKGGMVINTASMAGLIPFHPSPLYCATKHAVVGLTRSLGLPYHLERDGIIFAALCPAFIDTAIIDKFQTDSLVGGLDPRKKYPMMSTEYVAEAVLKLLEDRINGSTLTVSKKGGYRYIQVQEGLVDLID